MKHSGIQNYKFYLLFCAIKGSGRKVQNMELHNVLTYSSLHIVRVMEDEMGRACNMHEI
jgi:hypothetical protein